MPINKLPPELKPRLSGDPERIGPYRVAGRLGAGGMGVVYGAVDAEGQPVAVKLVHAEYAADPEFRVRFAREVELVRLVQARCTPAFAGADTEADTPWLATEYVPGPTLREHVQAEGALEGGMLTALSAGLAEALHAIHAAGVVHRDLKPGNVILSSDGPKVLDFGIAQALDATKLTRTGGLVGSPGWIAPERYEGHEATPATDVFAWGGLVAYAATGRNPFGTGAPNVVAMRTLKQKPDLTGVPESLMPLVSAALFRDPGQRPDTEALASELASGATGAQLPGTAPTRALASMLDADWQDPVPTEHRTGEWHAHTRSTRGRGVWIALGVAATTILLGLALVATLSGWPTQFNGPRTTSETLTDSTEENAEIPQAASTDSTLPGNVVDFGELSAREPGFFVQSLDDQIIMEIELISADRFADEIEFTGEATYQAASGSRPLGTGSFYSPTPEYDEESDLIDFPFEQRSLATPGETFGVISPEHTELTFTFSLPHPPDLDAGALAFNTDGAQTDPHLCFRSEPYAETGTQFLHNEGDSWQDCAADPYP
jgi:serine/threonine protein kinase